MKGDGLVVMGKIAQKKFFFLGLVDGRFLDCDF
jgi:hypothetical protein